MGEHRLSVIHTPGHSPGGICLFPTIIESIRTRLLGLPGSTRVHPGHGADTTIGAEAPHLDEWLARGH
ncbi:MAG TPA: MBL fold metallo-hydrolase [Acidimicrobiales bacterium]|nr:MBL fold metallo-hydrolase [Acidimicrobiales bacterium]